MSRVSRRWALAAGLALPAAALAHRAPGGRPRPGTALAPGPGPSLREQAILLSDGRHVPIRLWWPGGEPDRLVAFSHGARLGSNRYDRLGSALAAAGHAVAMPAHDEEGDPAVVAGRRLADMLATLSLLESLAPGKPMVAAGHSYGALIAQVAGGARPGFDTGSAVLPDPRVRLVVAFSPPGPLSGFIDAEGWAHLAVGHMTLTGTADVVPPVAPRWEDHLAAHHAIAASPRWLWVGKGVDHWFGNRIGRPERPEDLAQSMLFDAAMAATAAFIEGAPAPGQPAGVRLETG